MEVISSIYDRLQENNMTRLSNTMVFSAGEVPHSPLSKTSRVSSALTGQLDHSAKVDKFSTVESK